MALKAEEKFDEENTDIITSFFFKMSICFVQKSVLRLRRFCCACMQTGMGLNGAWCVS